MPLGEQIASQLPYLRRYARALTGSQQAGDGFVQATLQSAVLDPLLRLEIARGRVALYRAFNRQWANAFLEPILTSSTQPYHEAAAQAQLAKVTPLNRQALLLTTLEDFTVDDTARILDISPDEVERHVSDAIAEIDRATSTSVLIIEDEPLIAMQLEDLVVSLGHRICGTASTRAQAREAFLRERPGLVLADIQLADGSSGLDAVDDILSLGDLPVVFITAFPERLLRGDRPEPTYLVTKPFQETAVRAAIGQALFFKSSHPVA